VTDYGSAIFIDTSVQLLRFIGNKDVKASIDSRLSGYGFSVTSLVVRQEFKRRFLTDVRYVRTALEKNEFDTSETLRYINAKLSSPHNRRKLSICLNVLASTGFNGHDLPDMGEKCHLMLSRWEDFGLDLFDASVGQVVRYSGCGCGASTTLGPTKCSVIKTCKINEFIRSRQDQSECILDFLKNATSPSKTAEIQKAEATLNGWLNTGTLPDSDNPCLTVGDLIIALESEGIPAFYTQNARESQFLCSAQEQTMIVQRNDGDEVRLAADRAHWPAYS
jgi:hypothetical protein